MRKLACVAISVAVLGLGGCSAPGPPDGPVGGAQRPDVPEAARFQALPAVMNSPSNPRTPEKVALGRMLFYDTRFSADGSVSCYVCHPLNEYGTTHRPRAVGRDHEPGARNEPSVLNAAGQGVLYWDGRASDVEAQASAPVLDPIEMGMKDPAAVVAVLRSIPGYADAFRRAFPNDADPLTFENFGRAIGAFERGLTTPSRFDQYLGGDQAALTSREKDGLRTFVEVGCAQCHSGTYLGGTSLKRTGAFEQWPDAGDPGRYAITHKAADIMVFKVPSLRNVEETWPYFHDGSVERLDDAIRMMGRYQLGKDLTDTEVTLIRTFLHSLTGEIDRPYIQVPVLPPSTGMHAPGVPVAWKP